MSGDHRLSDEALTDQIRTAIDATPLSPEVVARLAAGRRRAVAAVAKRPLYVPRPWLPVGALAATLLAVVLLRPAMDMDATPLLEDDVQLAAAADLDLLENLEFAAWMDESDVSDEG
jgi:hypothetical protein